MTSPQARPPAIRIGRLERDAAARALDEHLSAGRLDAEEYGERSARAALARSQSELDALFVDLPEPRPRPATPAPAWSPPAPSTQARSAPASTPDRSPSCRDRGERRVGSGRSARATGLAGGVATATCLVAGFAFGAWWLFAVWWVIALAVRKGLHALDHRD